MIELKPNTPDIINYKVYPLMAAEWKATQKFIDENKALQYIKKLDLP